MGTYILYNLVSPAPTVDEFERKMMTPSLWNPLHEKSWLTATVTSGKQEVRKCRGVQIVVFESTVSSHHYGLVLLWTSTKRPRRLPEASAAPPTDSNHGGTHPTPISTTWCYIIIIIHIIINININKNESSNQPNPTATAIIHSPDEEEC